MRVADPDVRAALNAAGAQTLSLSDGHYPALLKTINDPPPTLFVRGNIALLDKPCLAIVGARRATAMGLKLAEEIAGAAVRAGLGVCSGLALGIDGAAHRGALAAGGDTVAVMGTGVETIYPQRHQQLGDEIAERGCLLTEFPPGTRPLPYNFPRRNRIISGLSLGVLVVEAALPSGSLITANVAAQQGREVFALPWSVAHKGGAGCLHLLRDGAKMVQGIDDILEELDSLYGLQLSLLEKTPAPVTEGSSSSGLLSLMGFEAVSVDQLSSASGVPPADVSVALSALELQGLVERCPGGYIRRR